MVAAVQNKRPCAVDPQNLGSSAIDATVSPKFQAARRIHDRNATHVIIENAKLMSAANNACCAACIDSTAKNTAPMAASAPKYHDAWHALACMTRCDHKG